MSARLAFIVGMQKSGTTLLARLMEEFAPVAVPFRREGNEFWGNQPPFAPTRFPAGEIYERYRGDRGHAATSGDATDEMRAVLLEHLGQHLDEAPLLLNKNPYNTVRLPWLRKLFPNAYIVAVVRRPVPNVFSLVKKYYPHKGRGQEPREGWWGVKPPGWREMVSDDKVRQSALQWAAVGSILAQDRELVDVVVPYHDLCADPAGWVEHLVKEGIGREIRLPEPIGQLRCFDDEFRLGSRMRSKNRYYREVRSLEVPEDEPIELGPLNAREEQVVVEICEPVVRNFPALLP